MVFGDKKEESRELRFTIVLVVMTPSISDIIIFIITMFKTFVAASVLAVASAIKLE